MELVKVTGNVPSLKPVFQEVKKSFLHHVGHLVTEEPEEITAKVNQEVRRKID